MTAAVVVCWVVAVDVRRRIVEGGGVVAVAVGVVVVQDALGSCSRDD